MVAAFAGVLCGPALAMAHSAEHELSYLTPYDLEEYREKFVAHGGATDVDAFDVTSDDEFDDY